MRAYSYRHRTLKHTCIKVLCSTEEWAYATKVGEKRNEMQRRHGKGDGMTIPENSLKSDIQGAVGEMAVAYALSKKWDGEYFATDEAWLYWRYHGTDVEGGVEVKSIDDPRKGLLIKTQERYKPEHPYVLALVDERQKTCHILGWMMGAEVKQDRFHKTATTKPAVPVDCYIADQDHLTPVGVLLDKISSLMPPDESEEMAEYLSCQV